MEIQIRMNKILTTTFGSHIYGTDTPKSDTDIKGIFIPDAQDILLCKAPKNVTTNTKADDSLKNTSSDVDTEYFAVHNFLNQLLQGQTFALDMIFTPQKHYLQDSDEWQEILKYRDQFIHKDIKPFFGYARQQAAKYGVKGSRMNVIRLALNLFKQFDAKKTLGHYATELEVFTKQVNEEFVKNMNDRELVKLFKKDDSTEPDIVYIEICDKQAQYTAKVQLVIDMLQKMEKNFGERARLAALNEGVDFKALSHAVRVGREAIELLNTGHITFPRPEAKLLLDIKTEQLPYVQVAPMIEDIFQELLEAEKNSKLPSAPNKLLADKIIKEIYYNNIRGTYGQIR